MSSQPHVGTRKEPGPAASGVSVVIVNFNGRHHLERCLPSVIGDTPAPVEVIVVDNGSTDGSVKWLEDRFPAVRVLPLERNFGFGAANRHGIEAAGTSYVALLNNDTEVRTGWLAPLVAALDGDPEIAIACSTLVLLDQPQLLNARGGGMTWLGYGFDRDFLLPAEPAPGGPVPPEIEDVLFPTAAAMLLRRREFLEIGGFDPTFFMYHEDVDLGWRLRLIGRRVVVCRDSLVGHRFGGTSHREKGLRWREHLGMRHNLRSLLKHYELRPLLRVAVGLAKIWLRQRSLAQSAHALSWNLAYLPSTLLARRWIQSRKRVHNLDLIDQGLIDGAAFPAPPPEPPRADLDRDSEGWIESGILLPAEDSAIGRLGFGWYPPEQIAGTSARWTCGHARCCLRVPGGTRGSLQLDVYRHRASSDDTIAVVYDGDVRRAEVEAGGWRTIEVPVHVREDGVLDLRLVSSRGIRHEVEGNWDFRRLGCAIRSIRLRPTPAASTASEPALSVVIPTHNRLPVLQETLGALERQSQLPAEVIVVDDGSSDGTWAWLERWKEGGKNGPRRVAVRQANLKQGQARNRGLRHASGGLVLFLGDDIVPEDGCVAAHVAAHRRLADPAAVVGFTDWHRERMRVTPFLEHINVDGPQFGFRWMTDGADVPFTCLYTSNVSIPAAVLGDRPFDPSFMVYGWEDSELGYRLARAGLRVVHARDARARHIHPMALRDFLRRQQQVGAAVHALFALHPELEDHGSMPPPQLRRTLRALAPVLRTFEPVAGILDGIGVALPVRIYRALVLTRYFEGKRRGAKTISEARP